jgi:hypothetical protein
MYSIKLNKTNFLLEENRKFFTRSIQFLHIHISEEGYRESSCVILDVILFNRHTDLKQCFVVNTNYKLVEVTNFIIPKREYNKRYLILPCIKEGLIAIVGLVLLTILLPLLPICILLFIIVNLIRKRVPLKRNI